VEAVLAYMNTVHGRQFRDTTQIAKLLGRGATVEECYLVIYWSFAIDRLEAVAQNQPCEEKGVSWEQTSLL
jgi:hypothetical protein